MLGFQAFAFSLACAAAAASASLPAHSYFEARRDPRLPAVVSIQTHLEEVERHLRSYPPEGLDDAEAAARAQRLDELRAYRLRGDFPRNLDYPDRVIPYFIDARGIACAVGHLMLLSGGADLAREIARTRNHAYIPELDDPRVADWARRNGLTLEECARIQPAYAPHYSDIIGLDLDRLGHPWVVTGKSMGMPGYPLSRRGDQGWTSFPYSSSDSFVRLCLVGETPLVIQGTGFSWNGGTPTAPEGDLMQMSACVGSLDGKTFWLGGTRGARRYVIEGSEPPRLAETLRAGIGALPGDTVTGFALVGPRTWIGTPKGLVYGTNGNWAALSLGTSRLGGMVAATDYSGIWYGLFGENLDPGKSGYFSMGGLIRQEATGSPHRYTSTNSPLPNDTIRMAAPGPGKSIWFTCDRKVLHRFIPPDTLETASFELPMATSILESDGVGRLYIGTYAPGSFGSSAQGLFSVSSGGGLVPLGYPGLSTAVEPLRRSGSLPTSGLWRRLGPGEEAPAGSDLLGRHSGRLKAAGMSIPESARRARLD